MNEFMKAVCDGEWVEDTDRLDGFTCNGADGSSWNVRRAEECVAITMFLPSGGMFLMVKSPKEAGRAALNMRKAAAVLMGGA